MGNGKTGTKPFHRVALTLVFTLAVVNPAHAQWQVVDSKLIQQSNDQWEKENDQRKQTNDSLEKLYDQQLIGAPRTAGSPGERVGDPEQALAEQTLEKGLENCKRWSKMQKPYCEELVKTENAQYRYAVAMYRTSEQRNERLRQIERERQSLRESDIGKLQDNSNKLAALRTLIAIDQQQMQSVNSAYETRLRYLRQEQARLALEATSGRSSTGDGFLDGQVGQWVDGIVSGALVLGALDAVKSDKPTGMRRLSSMKD